MARPTIHGDTITRLDEMANARSKVNAENLTTDQKVSLLLDELQATTNRIQRLENQVEQWKAKAESKNQNTPGADTARSTQMQSGSTGFNNDGW